MNVTAASRPTFATAAKPKPTDVSRPEPTHTQVDSVTLGGRKDADYGKIGMATLFGAAPVVGAFTHIAGMLEAGMQGKYPQVETSVIAAGVNLVATGTLVGGLLSGNSLLAHAGLGMLGISGLAAGVTSYALR